MRALVRPPALLRNIYRGALWRMDRDEKIIYLTFDDGPVPGVTPAALSVLKEHDVRATFFCVGDNVRKHPEIFQQLLAEGHAVGNHTFHHTDGWNTATRPYLREVQQCAEVVRSNLFRPPYGRMRPPQLKAIRRKYTVVLWDVLTYDFDRERSGEECLELALDYARPGSIVVFHDSEKAKERMLYALPRFIEAMKREGFAFGTL
jgi:peptidoglycan-N-acetylglucosamine deacetylase